MRPAVSAAASAAADLLIVVVSYNTRDYLEQCLRSIYASTHRAKFRIVVVDNGSVDGSAQMVAGSFPEVELICNAENVGFARANNQALARNDCRYAVLLNSDTVVLDGALDVMVAFLDGQPDAGAAGPRLLNPAGDLQPSCNRRFTLPHLLADWALEHTGLYRRLGIDKFTVRGWNYDTVGQVDLLSGACIMVRAEALTGAGLLDEGYVNGVEDHDWCLRIRDAGWRIYYLPGAAVIHYWGQSFRQLAAPEREMFGLLTTTQNYRRFVRKHYGAAASWAFEAVAAGRMGLSLLKWSAVWLRDRSRRPEAGPKVRVRLDYLRRGGTAWITKGITNGTQRHENVRKATG